MKTSVNELVKQHFVGKKITQKFINDFCKRTFEPEDYYEIEEVKIFSGEIITAAYIDNDELYLDTKAGLAFFSIDEKIEVE